MLLAEGPMTALGVSSEHVRKAALPGATLQAARSARQVITSTRGFLPRPSS